jgi:hypothetical protein
MMAEPTAKRVPLGQPLQLTDEQLDQFAEVSQEDIEKAKAFWRNNAPPKFASLLDAETLEEDEEQ